jgi:PAS domain S-box-containing protein
MEAELPFPISTIGENPSRFAPSVIVADTTGTVRSLNVAACRLFGYRQNELVGMTPKAVADQHDLILQRYTQEGSFQSSTTRVMFGLTKAGTTIRIRIATSFMISETCPLITAMIDEVIEHAFLLKADKSGVIFAVEGNCEETCGYAAAKIIGLNVSVLCPSAVSRSHQSYISEYKRGSDSK